MIQGDGMYVAGLQVVKVGGGVLLVESMADGAGVGSKD
jgi:hypothetical protein